MNRFKFENEEYLIKYLKETEKLYPELLDMFYPLTVTAIDYLCAFEDILSEDIDCFEHKKMDIRVTLELVREFLK